METVYKLSVEQGKTTEEEGFFFKAFPFEVSFQGGTLQFLFQKGKKHHVVYAVVKDGVTVAELEHPDYIPEPEDVAAFSKKIAPIKNGDVVFVLKQLGVAKAAAHFLEDVDPMALTYQVTQTKS